MSSEFWNERYAADTYIYGTDPNDFVREQAASIPPGRVLCLAEGEGRNAVFLAGLGHAVTAVDFSREGLRKARSLAERRGVTVDFVLADVTQYQPEPGAYSGVISSWLHLAPAERTVVHGRIAQALAPGGVVVLEAYTPDQLAFATGGPKDANLLYRRDHLVADFTGLEILIAVERERDVFEGAFHGGKSAVVQLLARKPA